MPAYKKSKAEVSAIKDKNRLLKTVTKLNDKLNLLFSEVFTYTPSNTYYIVTSGSATPTSLLRLVIEGVKALRQCLLDGDRATLDFIRSAYDKFTVVLNDGYVHVNHPGIGFSVDENTTEHVALMVKQSTRRVANYDRAIRRTLAKLEYRMKLAGLFLSTSTEVRPNKSTSSFDKVLLNLYAKPDTSPKTRRSLMKIARIAKVNRFLSSK